jgi:hypothetical protein
MKYKEWVLCDTNIYVVIKLFLKEKLLNNFNLVYITEQCN